mmetsp:Transcript_43739/g.56098  ORF Transcript_43739/g.56098 Transcript_43739/m.56098 type:complete len:82 (-) Transcript_43739:1029-1274(-)
MNSGLISSSSSASLSLCLTTFMSSVSSPSLPSLSFCSFFETLSSNETSSLHQSFLQLHLILTLFFFFFLERQLFSILHSHR